ncbi:hypothetical protein GCM10007967_27050 [Xylanimonas ulmi]
MAECVTQSARELLADTDTAPLTEQLSDCASTMFLNKDLSEAIREADADRGLSYHNSSLALTGVATGNALELTFYSQGNGYAEAGINSARVSLGTCWRIVVDDGPRQPKEISGVTCDEVLIARTRPKEVVPFEDVDLAPLKSEPPSDSDQGRR